MNATKRRDRATASNVQLSAFEDAISAYRWPALLVPIVLLVLATLGSLDAIRDVDGVRSLGYAPVLACCLMTAWWAVSIVFERPTTTDKLVARGIAASMLVQIPLVLANALVAMLLYLTPPIREFVDWNSYRLEFWSDGLFFQLAIIPFLSYFFGAVTGLFTVLVVVFPAMVFIDPDVLKKGSKLEGYRPDTWRENYVGYVFLGLSALVVGLVTKMLLARNVAFADVLSWFRQESGSPHSSEVFLWILGVALLGLALSLISYGILKTAKYRPKKDD